MQTMTDSTSAANNSSRISPVVFDGREVEPAEVGMNAAGVGKIAQVFAGQIADGLQHGAQLVLLRHGRVVLDRAAGVANIKSGLPVGADTPFHLFSISKPFTGMCMHKLIEQGRVALDAPVCEYWPEFGQSGKESATIRHVFLHQAGIPSRGLRAQIPLWVNWGLVTNNVAHLQAEFAPGSKTSYHAVNYGFILGEVIRRVSGKPVRQFMQEEFFGPLGLKHSHLGLPWKLTGSAARIYCGDPEQDTIVKVFNLPFIRGALMPAATLNSTARDIAVFFQMLLNQGEYAGRRYVQADTVARAVSLGYEGFDEYINAEMRWAYGFHLGGSRRPGEPIGGGMGHGSSLSTFGHAGQNSSFVWADSERQLVLAFTTNRLLAGDRNTERFAAISNAVWDALGA